MAKVLATNNLIDVANELVEQNMVPVASTTRLIHILVETQTALAERIAEATKLEHRSTMHDSEGFFSIFRRGDSSARAAAIVGSGDEEGEWD